MNLRDALSRLDRVVLVAVAVLLSTAGAGVGALIAPSADQSPEMREIVRIVQTPVAAAPIDLQKASTDAVLASLIAEHKCLTQVMYYEARGEGEEGQKAVAEVVLNRLTKKQWGRSLCEVVFAKSAAGTCQFTFVCDGSMNRPVEDAAWRETSALAAEIMAGQAELVNATDGAINYHTASIHTYWDKDKYLVRTGQIGNHIFFRRGKSEPNTRIASAS